jgi:tripartite-type tricarboxylate transporter receptor subunit TctC
MAIYMFPDLLQWISPELKKRMQEKSCFNFTRVDERLFRELDEQTKRVFERFKDSGSIS